ncbi:MAG: glycoside hydrolase family 140 protein [Bacteroidia bacterium]|nr:glycoside hydrolase family 140 protein [Bacteroidia bacterium]
MLRIAFLLLLLCLAQGSAYAQLQVHEGRRYLQTLDGQPFFWLGDTDWELFHRLDRGQAIRFLDTRQRQGFNVIQAVALAEEDGLRVPNRYGDLPLVDEDPARLATTPGDDPADPAAYDYWDHVDFIIREAARRGMYVALLPTWGDKVAHMWGAGPIVFDERNAEIYARTLAERYRSQWNVIWMLGGDRPAVYTFTWQGQEGSYDDRPVWRAMARGIESVLGPEAFITYHPAGGPRSTSQYIHDEPWLDINGFQSGHGERETPAWDWVTRDLALQPLKPTLDLEPCYEDHPVNPWDGRWTRSGRGYFDAYDVRARTYRSVLAGGCGVTYGHHQIWQFLDTALYRPVNIGDTIIGWEKALQAKGAWQMQHLKNLVLSRPLFARTADPALVLSSPGTDYRDRIIAARDTAGSYAMVYLPQSKPVTIDLTRLAGTSKRAWWYDPATGRARSAGPVSNTDSQTFTPPATPQDWVLVIDDASKKYGKPGKLR